MYPNVSNIWQNIVEFSTLFRICDHNLINLRTYKNQKCKESIRFFSFQNGNCIKPSEYLKFSVEFENMGKIEVQSPCVVTSETETFYQQSCIVRGGKNAVGVRGRHGSGACLQRPLMITKNLLHNFQTFQGVRTMSQTIGLSSILPFFAILKSKFSETATVHFVSSDFKSRIATM